MAKVKIQSTASTTIVLIDGHEVHGITELKLEMNPAGLPVLHLKIAALDNEITLDDVWVKRSSGKDKE